MVTHKQIWRLAWAVREAKRWQGLPDSAEERDEYRRWIGDAEEALKQLRRMKKDEAK
jgi:hypothetical protein